ncbi:MAG TPA: methyltransferase type 11, partial [Methylomirabilota bacterium]|nr:methyltransferase type 11 [Methylomirabilota bacterium]
WMYDRFSLGRLLRKAGLVDIVVRGAGDSYLPDWASYSLDVEEDGSVVKPDSLFLEGRKPIPNSDRGQ